MAQLGTASSGFGFADEKLASTTGAELGEDRSSAGWGREAPTHEFALPTFNGMYGLAAGGLALATGGVGGSTAASSGVAGLPAALSSAVKVVVYDGLIKGASIYVDRNHDGKTDTSEKVGETDKDGVLHLSNLSSDDLKGVFLAVGGTNIDTGLPNSMQLQATSDGSGLVTLSPVSSLLAALQEKSGPNLSSADADKAVKQAFGFSDGFNLKTYDPSTASTQPDALKFQKAGAQIAALVSDVVLSSVAVPKLASYIVSNTAKVNLDSVDTLKAIYGTDTATVTAIQDVAVATTAIALASTAPQVVAAQYSSLAPVIVGLLNDTGSSSTDKLTTDPRLNVSGVTVGSHVQYSVDSGAHWVAAESFAPGAGPVTVSARLAYDNGFTTTASGPFTFTLSVATPVAPTLTLHHDSAPGAADAVNTDRVTNVATIDVGNVDANAVLEFSTDQIHWSSTQPQAVEGLNNLYAHQVYTLTGATSAVTPLTFTLDTHANVGTLGLAANVLGADVVNDTGITGDGITSNALPILSGQTEANASSVSVTLGGHSYSVAAADLSADGHWTLTVGGALADGTYIPTLTVVDAAGNISAPTAMAPITIDSVAPVAGTAALSASSDTGFASDDGLTSQTHPVIEGVTEAHANVAVDIDGSVYRTAADATGHWSVLVTTALTDGDYTPSITVTDAAGNVSDAVDGTPFSVYATPPQETIHAGLSQDDGVSETVPFQGTDVTLADDPGTFASDGITSNPIPLIVGEVDAPGTVVIMRLNGVTYTTVADDAGDWSIQIPEDNALDDGTYVPGLLYVDPAGNMTHLSGAPITIDTAAPDDVSGDLVHDDTNDTGIDNSDGITNNASPTLEGTTEAFAWVSVDIGGTVLDAVQADATGYWQVTADGLSDGTYTPIITVSDAAGNMTQSEGGVITIDTTAPEGTTGVFVHDADNDTGVSSTDGITNNNSPTLEGHAEANAHVTVDVGGTVFETDADANGYWTLTADGLDDGDYTPSIVVTDLAGNESDPVDGESFTVLTVGPDEGSAELVHDDVNDTGVDTEDNITANNKPELFGTAGAPDALVSVDLNGEVFTTKADANGDWVLKVDHALADGDYVPVISVSDLAGNVTETEGTPFTVDTQAPTADTVTAELLHDDTNDTGLANDDNITNNSAPEISGTADPLAYVHVDLVDAGGAVYAGFDTQADENGDWSQALDSPLDDGTYTPMVSVIDLAGNQSAEIPGVEFTVDTTAPTGTTGVFVHNADNDTGSSSTDGITNNNSPTLEGHTEANAHVAVDVGGTLFETDADGNGYWTLTADGLDDGDYTPSIVVTDLAGNESDPVDGESFTVLTAVPDAPDGGLTQDSINDTGVAADDGITNNNLPMLSGTAAAGGTVTVEIGDLTYTTTADELGAWTVQVTTPLADGEYTPVMTVSDLAGNVSDPFEGALIVVDTHLDPISGGLTHDDVNDTGISTDDGVTNNIAPLMSGTVEPLATVVMTLNQIRYEVQADDTGYWEIQVDTDLPDGTYIPTLQVTDLAGNTATVNGEPLTIDTMAAFADVGLPGNVMIHVGELIDFNPMANLPSGSGEIVVEDYSGTLPAGLSIDAAGHIVGLPTETGVTYITMTAIDDAGNTAQASFQVAVTALDKTANTAVNNADTATAAGYIGTDAGEHINMYSSAGDVLLAGGGNDLFQLFKPEALGFARIDGGAGVDQMKFSGVGVSMDFSAFNNIDGSGQVIEHVEEFYFAGTQSDITITAADIFALKSDIHDANYSLIRIMSTVNNGGTVTLGDSDVVGGLTMVAAPDGSSGVDAYGATGGAKSGASADKYTKFTGTYTDGNGDHLVELLLQHGLTAA